MKKDKLLELIKYIKENDLIQKYNDVYKEYDEKKEMENPGFRLQDLYYLTEEEVDLILSSKHDTEALFRLRMNSVHYKELMNCEVKLNDTVVLETIEDFSSFEDYEEYDKDKTIIELIMKQDKECINNIILFLSHMGNKKLLGDTNLSIDYLCEYLSCIAKCKTYKSANLIALLASSSKERTECGGMHSLLIDVWYELKVIDKISECERNFQSDCIETLLRMREHNPKYNSILINNIRDNHKKIKVIGLFTKTDNEEACKRMLEIIKESIENLRNRPDNVISMLEECSLLKYDEEYVDITTITEVEDLERILGNMDESLEIDEFVKVKVKKKKNK